MKNFQQSQRESSKFKAVGSESFQPSVTGQKRTSFISESPFYNVLAELRAESHSALQGIQIGELVNNSRQAFILKINSKPSHHLFSECQYRERHFSIDKVYKTSVNTQHGRTPIHYTETYFSAYSNECLIVHAYLNQQGRYMYAQLKKKYADGATQEAVLNEALIDFIRKNVTEATESIQFLFTEREVRYAKAQQKVDILENELAATFEQLKKTVGDRLEAQETLWQQYSNLAKELAISFEEFNRYSEIKSKRSVSIQKTVDYVDACRKEWALSDMVQVVPNATEIDSSLQDLAPLAVRKIQDSTISVFEQGLAKFKEDADHLHRFAKRAFESHTLEQLLEIRSFVERVKEQLLWVFAVPKDYFEVCKEIKQLLHKVYIDLDKYDKKLVSILEDGILNGKISIVENVFPLVGHRLRNDVYQELINLIVNEDKSKNSGKIQVCYYLYQNSNVYISTVRTMSKEVVYSLSKTEHNKFKSHLVVSEDFKDLVLSGLFKLYCKNNLPAFEMLLVHGADAITWGLAGTLSGSRAPFTMLHCVAAFGTSYYLPYLEALLRHGADPNGIYTTEVLKFQMQNKIKNIKGYLLAKQKVESRLGAKSLRGSFMQEEEQKPMPPLQVVADREDLNALELLLSYSNLGNIALCLGFLVNQDHVRTCMSPVSQEPFIAVVNDRVVATVRATSQLELGEWSFGTFVFYPNSSQLDPTARQKSLETIKRVHQFLEKEIQRLKHKQQFEEAYRKLFSLGERHFVLFIQNHAKDDIDRAYGIFRACDFLLTEAAKRLNAAGKLALVKRYLVELIKKILQTITHTSLSAEQKQGLTMNYNLRIAHCKNMHLLDVKKDAQVQDPWEANMPLTVSEQPYSITWQEQTPAARARLRLPQDAFSAPAILPGVISTMHSIMDKGSYPYSIPRTLSTVQYSAWQPQSMAQEYPRFLLLKYDGTARRRRLGNEERASIQSDRTNNTCALL